MMAAMAKCTMRGCPVRYRAGPDRPCFMHADDGEQLAARAADLGVTMTTVPGESEGDDGEGGESDSERAEWPPRRGSQ